MAATAKKGFVFDDDGFYRRAGCVCLDATSERVRPHGKPGLRCAKGSRPPRLTGVAVAPSSHASPP